MFQAVGVIWPRLSSDLRHRHGLLLTRPAVLLGEGRPDQTRESSGNWAYTMRRDRRLTMIRAMSLRPRAKARVKMRVTQMASKLYSQLKALYKTTPLGATDSIKVQWPTVLICVSFLLCFITGNLATSRFWNLCDIIFLWFWHLRKNKNLAISWTPLFGLNWAEWSQNFWKNSSAHR